MCRTRAALSYRVDSVEPVSRRERMRSLQLQSRVVLWSLPNCAQCEHSKSEIFTQRCGKCEELPFFARIVASAQLRLAQKHGPSGM